MDEADRESRMNDAVRVVQFAGLNFDARLAKGRGQSSEFINNLPYVPHLHKIRKELEPRVPEFIITHHCQHRPKSTKPVTIDHETIMQMLAVVLAHVAHNFHTGNLRQVPSSSVVAALRAENSRRRDRGEKPFPPMTSTPPPASTF